MFIGKSKLEKVVDNVEVYVTADAVDKKTGLGEIKLNSPLVGVSAVEVASVELPNVVYNLPFDHVIDFGYPTYIKAGSYTSQTFAEELQRTLNLASPTPFTVLLDAKDGKLTISNSINFTINNMGTWNFYLRILMGHPRQIIGVPDVLSIGPQSSYTFPIKSNDTFSPVLAMRMKVLLDKTTRPNGAIGGELALDSVNYVETIPLVNNYGTQNNFFKVKNKLSKFRSKYTIKSIDLELLDTIIGNPIDVPWSATLIFYF
jgi:hypothetical protein